MPELDPANPQPGVYMSVPMAVYQRIDLPSSSRLKKLAMSPAKCKYAIDHPEWGDTDALKMGRAIHAAILEPEVYKKQWIIRPPGLDRRRKEGKAAYAILEQKAKEIGGEIIKHDEDVMAQAIRDAVMADEIAGQLLTSEKGGNEVTIIWRDKITGLLCKGRIDRVTDYQGFTVHIDLKSTTDASPDGYKWQVRKYKYHASAAFYLDGCEALAPGKRRFLHIPCEKEPPYDVGVYEFEAQVDGEPNQISLDEGRSWYRLWLKEYKKCMDSGRWPSYGGIHPLYI